MIKTLISSVLLFSSVAAFAGSDADLRMDSAWLLKLPVHQRAALDLRPEHQSLLPKEFRFADADSSRSIVDDLTAKMFLSRTVRNAFCFLGSESTTDFSHFLGVSPRAAKVLRDRCAKVAIPAVHLRVLSMMKARILDSPTYQRPKTYLMFFTKDELPAIEGFTDQNGVTFVMLNQKELSTTRLLRVLLHELAISFDQLAALSPRYSSQDWREGLEIALGLKNGKEDVFVPTSSISEFRCALRDPAIRYAIAAERAFRFEDQVINDLGLQNLSKATALSGSCAQVIAKRAVQISPMAGAIWQETDFDLFREECGVDLLHDAERAQTLVGRIRLLAKAQLQFKDATKSARPLCDVLLSPHVGPRRPDNLRAGGPRPRVGGWD